MKVSKTEEKIVDFEAYIESEKLFLPPMGTYVKKKQIDKYLSELKEHLDSDFSELHSLMATKEQIILEAQQEADRIRQHARMEVERQDIVIQARDMARDMIQKAQVKAETMLSEAKELRNQLIVNSHKYVDNVLDDMEKELITKQDQISANREQFRNSLDKKMDLMQQSNF